MLKTLDLRVHQTLEAFDYVTENQLFDYTTFVWKSYWIVLVLGHGIPSTLCINIVDFGVIVLGTILNVFSYDAVLNS